VSDKSAEIVLNMLTDAIGAINAGESADRAIVTHLYNALDAEIGVSVHCDPRQALELVIGLPDAATAAPLFNDVASEWPTGMSGHVTVGHVAGVGYVVYIVIPPAPDARFMQVLAFARDTPYDDASCTLLKRSCQPLRAVWPLAARAYARERAARHEYSLTSRELDVLGLLAQGLLATSIASRLNLSPRTVHKHLGNIYRKLGVHDRLVAVSLARANGLLDVAN